MRNQINRRRDTLGPASDELTHESFEAILPFLHPERDQVLTIAILCPRSACATTSPDGATRLAEAGRAGIVVEEIGQGSAQTELIGKPIRITTPSGQTVEIDASAPFFWAAFQLFGDRL